MCVSLGTSLSSSRLSSLRKLYCPHTLLLPLPMTITVQFSPENTQRQSNHFSSIVVQILLFIIDNLEKYFSDYFLLIAYKLEIIASLEERLHEVSSYLEEFSRPKSALIYFKLHFSSITQNLLVLGFTRCIQMVMRPQSLHLCSSNGWVGTMGNRMILENHPYTRTLCNNLTLNKSECEPHKYISLNQN